MVDRIDDRIKAGVEDFGRGVFGEKLLTNLDLGIGVDRSGALGHGIGFLSADLAIHRVELAIHIRDADFIEVDECQVADARSRECFDRP